MFTQRKYTSPFANLTNKFMQNNIPRHPTKISSNLLKHTIRNHSTLPEKNGNLGIKNSNVNNLNNLNNKTNNTNNTNYKTNNTNYKTNNNTNNNANYNKYFDQPHFAVTLAYFTGFFAFSTHDKSCITSFFDYPMPILFFSSICGFSSACCAFFVSMISPTKFVFVIPSIMSLVVSNNLLNLIKPNDEKNSFSNSNSNGSGNSNSDGSGNSNSYGSANGITIF